MAKDNLLALQSLTTQTASASSTGLDLKTGTPKRGLVANIRVTAVSGTSPTCQFKLQHSDDNTTFTDVAVSQTFSATGLADVTFVSNKRYHRVTTVIDGTSPSFAWDAYIGTGQQTVE